MLAKGQIKVDVIDTVWNHRKRSAFISIARAFIAVSMGALLATVAGVLSFSQTAPPPGSAVADGTFVSGPGSPYTIGPPGGSAGIASGDFNGDGLPDLVIGGDQITILLATTGGGFVQAPGSPIRLGIFPTGVAVSDLNGDGILDIAVLSVGDLYILLGDGHGGFTVANQILVYGGRQPNTPVNAIGVADFNRDGKPDLVFIGTAIGGSPDAVTVLLGDGTGNFTPAPGGPLNVGLTNEEFTVADFNMDGNPDIAVTLNNSREVVVLLGDGTGRFVADPNGPFPTGLTPIAIAHGDFNGDGKVDLAVANWAGSTVTILIGDGTGGFTRLPDTNVPYIPKWLSVGDIDGDGLQDLVVSFADGPSSGVYVLLGDGKGGFRSPGGPGFITFAGGPVAAILADFNGDGRLDLATSNFDVGTVSVFLGAPAPSSFQLSLWPTSPNPAVGVPLTFSLAPTFLGFDAPTGAVALLDGSTVVSTAQLGPLGDFISATFSTAGVHSLVAVYQGDLLTTGSTTTPLAINVAQGSQTISFPLCRRMRMETLLS
jgi:hypothetical protein